MSIKAIVPQGATSITAHGLTQWDYGQTLEIAAEGIPAFVEVHFASPGMKEAVVRVGTTVSNVVTVPIPDQCLEQAAPVKAYIYAVEEASARTLCTITLPVVPRLKPAKAAPVPAFIPDKYTELVDAVNAQVEALARGEVVAGSARFADTAGATHHAETAGMAQEAANASWAAGADMAMAAKQADEAAKLTTAPVYFTGNSVQLTKAGLYEVRVRNESLSSLTTEAATVVGLISITDVKQGRSFWLTGAQFGINVRSFYQVEINLSEGTQLLSVNGAYYTSNGAATGHTLKLVGVRLITEY